MKTLFLMVVGAALVSGCFDSDGRRAVDDNLTRPLEVARVDTTQALAPIEHQVTPLPEPAPMPKPRKAGRAPKKPVTPPAPAVETAEVDTTDIASTPTSPLLVGPDTSASQPDATAPQAARSAGTRTLPIGTEIHAALDDSINSRTDSAGRVVTAVVMENVAGSDGKTLIAAGAPVRFTVVRLNAASSKSSQGRLVLRVDGVGVAGELRQVSADVRPVPHELRGRGVGTSEAAKVGVGAAGGAILGRVIGGNTKGAVIGGVVGAAGGAVVASQTADRDVVVKARTPVTFILTEPLAAP
jgi:hypothetical protein